jgi:hypothetical protein
MNPLNKPSFSSIDKDMRTLMTRMSEENTLKPETQSGRLERLLKIYAGIKPLLAVLSALPLVPARSRAALILFTEALEAVAAVAPDNADFKAGKDI